MNYNTFDIHQLIPQSQSNHEENLFPEDFCGIAIGGPGSGKTTLALALYKHSYGFFKKFDLTLFISPNPLPQLDIPDNRYKEVLDVDWIIETINYFKKTKMVSNCLVFCDDVVSTISKGASNQQLIDLFFNRRKLVSGVCISLLCTTQKFTLFPARFRATLDFLIVFRTPIEDLNTIIKQHIDTNAAIVRTIAKSHYSQDRHNFLFVRINPSYKLFLNFKKAI